MADEPTQVVLGQTRLKYSASEYLEYIDQIKKICKSLEGEIVRLILIIFLDFADSHFCRRFVHLESPQSRVGDLDG